MSAGKLRKGELPMKRALMAALLAAALCVAAGAATASAGSSTINGTTHCNPADPLCMVNPLVTGPPPPFASIASNCPAFLSTDTWSLDFVDGNSVSHGTLNKNGDWGGFTATGPAVLTTSDGTVQYSGHATAWGGGGQNSNPGGPPANQSVNGFTLHFNGSGVAGTISIHAHMHSTTNNSGRMTNSVLTATVTC
jgi:hypothetical protein